MGSLIERRVFKARQVKELGQGSVKAEFARCVSLCCSGSTGSLLIPCTKFVRPHSSLGICQFLSDTAGQQDLSPLLPTLSLRLLRPPDFSPGTSLPSLDKAFSLHIICSGIAT